MSNQIKNFNELGLSPNLLKTIEKVGYTTPTPVQQLAIPAILNKQDVIGISQTGTGKTAAFILPIISNLENGRSRARMPRCLILSPTRELTTQIADNFRQFTKDVKLNTASLIGGEAIEKQSRILNKNIDVLIATPGRLLDHIQRGNILLNAIEILIIDEADRMLDMGFIKDIEKIINHLTAKHTTVLFSATMAAPIEKLAKKYLNNPIKIETARQSSVAQNITQNWLKSFSEIEHKKSILLKILNEEKNDIINAIIFCNRKIDTTKLHKWLVNEDFNAIALNGNIQQNARSRILRDFKKGKYQLLVATDIAARGLDIEDIGYVFNFDLPRNKEDYIHRIGRTGRAGRSGKAYNIVSRTDIAKAREIEKVTKQKITWIDNHLKDTPLAHKESENELSLEKKSYIKRKISNKNNENKKRTKPKFAKKTQNTMFKTRPERAKTSA